MPLPIEGTDASKVSSRTQSILLSSRSERTDKPAGFWNSVLVVAAGQVDSGIAHIAHFESGVAGDFSLERNIPLPAIRNGRSGVAGCIWRHGWIAERSR